MNKRYILAVAQKLFTEIQEQESFVEALDSASRGSGLRQKVAIAWVKPRPGVGESSVLAEQEFSRECWQPECVDVLPESSEPGKLKLHSEGYYYVLDVSSALALSTLWRIKTTDASCIDDTPQNGPIVIDLCASPGGKSVLAFSLLTPSLIVANEAVPKRLGSLISNIKRCQIRPSLITNYAPDKLSQAIPSTADFVLVDAPCSGQSLLLKGQKNPGCFHPQIINMNAKRQRYILAQAAKLVIPGGYVAYTTCTFSRKENEDIASWFLETYPNFTACEVPHLSSFKSHLSAFPSFRIWPNQGAGGFSVLLRRTQEDSPGNLDTQNRQERILKSGLRVIKAF